VRIVESLVKPTIMAVVVAMTVVTACARDSAPIDDGSAPSPPWSQYIWQSGDITDTTGAPPAGGGGLAAYAFEAQGTQHVIYSSALDNHVRELWWNINGWHTADLTALVGAPPAAQPITGYVFQAENTQHVVYNGVDNRIHELWFDGTGWHTGDLTAATATPPVAAGGALAGYAFDTQDTQHVMYISAPDNHIRELWSDGTGWRISDLTATTGAPTAAATGPLTAYPFEKQRTQHIIYASGDGRLHELWCERTIWHTNDLTATTGAPPAQTLAGYAVEAQGTQHVVYSGLDHRLYELWWNNGWHLGDLTAATDAPALGGGGPIGYAFEVQATQHVIYVSAGDGHVREIWWGPPVNRGDSRPGGVPQASQATARNAPRSSPTPP
jgi:hypothetical protein